MRSKLALIVGLLAAASASTARAQQAPIPNPPTRVNPVPQQPKDCRGCTETADDKKTSVGKYDEKNPGTVRPTVRPDVKAKPKVKQKPKAKVHSKRKPSAAKGAAKKSVTPATKPKPMFKDRPAIGDPILRTSIGTTASSTAATMSGKRPTTKK